MKSTEALIIEAKKIISKEHFSPLPRSARNSIAGRHLRKVFMSNCMEEFGTSFTNHMAGYIAPAKKANHHHTLGGSISRPL